MSDDRVRLPRPQYWIRVRGTVPRPLLGTACTLEVARAAPSTILHIESDETPAELMTRLRSRGLDVLSVRPIA